MRQSPSHVLIIEDDPIIAGDLEWIVRDLGLRVIGIAATRSSAVALVRQAAPDLLLSDINLADGSSGVDAVLEIVETCRIPAIFITATPHKIPAELSSKTFLVMKPYRELTVKETIGEALTRRCDCPKYDGCHCPSLSI